VQQVNLGMIGGGTVGSGVFHALQLNGGALWTAAGTSVAFSYSAVLFFLGALLVLRTRPTKPMD
jgi:homoserine dehydrogenase